MFSEAVKCVEQVATSINVPDPLEANFVAADGGFDVGVCVDLVSRVWTRFGGGGVYRKFSDCMQSFTRGEVSAAHACEEAVRLFDDNCDLIAEFSRFVEGTKRRHIIGKRKRRGGKEDVEDLLVDVDVRLSILESVRVKALQQLRHLSPADVPLHDRFTSLNLGFIRKMGRNILQRIDRDMPRGLRRLLDVLDGKKTSMDEERLRILQKWDKICRRS